MQTAFVVFEGLTALDFVGIYDPLTRLSSMRLTPDFQWRICSLQQTVSDGKGLRLMADSVGESLEGFDLLVVPGGLGTRSLQHDVTFIRWLQTAVKIPLKASVCTGSLLLGAAGFLQGKPATTHPSALAELAPYCAEVVGKRIVDAGDVITAGGVTAAIDLGLYLVERLAGTDARATVARQMEYSYHGPQPVDRQAVRRPLAVAVPEPASRD